MNNAVEKKLQEFLESLSADALQALLEEASTHVDPAPRTQDGPQQQMADTIPSFKVMPATQAQELFWRMYTAHPEACENHQSLSFRITGPLDAEALAEAFQAISESQPSLRTVFFESDGDVFQRILPVLPIPVERIRTDAVPGDDIVGKAGIDAFLWKPFLLGEEPPIRVRIVSWGEEEHLLQIVLHHIATDGRSKIVLLEALSKSYSTLLSGGRLEIRDRYPILADWVERERTWLGSGDARRAVEYWKGLPYTKGMEHTWPEGRECSARMELPVTGEGAMSFQLSGEHTEKFHAFAAERGLTDFQLWVGTYILTLQRLMPGVPVTVGMPVDVRYRTEDAELVGCLMNMVPVTMDAEMPSSVDDYLRKVGQRMLEAMEHARLPWLRIREESLIAEGGNRKAGWRTIVNFKEDYAGALLLSGAVVEELPFIQTGYSADLVLTLPASRERGNGRRFEWTAEPAVQHLPLVDAACLMDEWMDGIGITGCGCSQSAPAVMQGFAVL
ncbi:MAG: hypothetical protein EBZ67_14200, partial [Chitinophagia bacterium]|nr:hypothetical protein [Chitinophagia bacterium]